MATSLLALTFSVMADSSGAVSMMRAYAEPTMHMLTALASLACIFFLMYGGYLYMTSGGKPDSLIHAKRVLRNALIGLVIVLAAATITSLLVNAYGHPAGGASAQLPSLQAIPTQPVSNGLVDVLIKAVTGFLNTIIQAVAAPFLAALTYFTQSTPLMASNPAVFNLWLGVVGITDVLFVIVLSLLGFHVMSAASFGFDEVDLPHLLPRVGLIFLLLNTSIFSIDGIIELSNVLIAAIGKVAGASTIWATLTDVVKESGGQGIAALLLMFAFLIFSVLLLVYYVVRLVSLFIGAVISPLVLLIWLVPGFRDFSETAIKTYLMTIFTLFIHVVILLLAASLFTGMSASSGNKLPDTLMALVVGIATVFALLKTQSVMMQLSYVGMGPRSMRRLGGQFMNGVSYLTDRATSGRKAAAAKTSRRSTALGQGGRPIRSSPGTLQSIGYRHPQTASVGVRRVPAGSAASTATTTPTPGASARGAPPVSLVSTKRTTKQEDI